MSRKHREKRRPSAPPRRWWSALPPEHRRRMVRRCAALFGLTAAFLGGAAALAHLDAQVKRTLLDDRPFGSVSFVDLPEPLLLLAHDDLHRSIDSLLDGPWTDERLCRLMAERVSRVGWVAQVHHVRRNNDAHFAVSCEYRMPVALVRHENDYYFVDREGVRLPGTYRFDAAWKRIEGVAHAPPEAGSVWQGKDLQAGLALLARLQGEPFAGQVVGIDVENMEGRRDSRRSHLEIVTDRPGGRIRWGSAPGRELEENTVARKLAMLRENFRRVGRADGGHLVIDIATYPDRYTVPD